MKHVFLYLLATRKQGLLDVGVTDDLSRTLREKRSRSGRFFLGRLIPHKLVYFEAFEDGAEAMLREKRLKGWKRAWKIALFEATNPDWRDLADEVQSDPLT